MHPIKLVDGRITPKTDFTDPDQLLNHLRYRARIYRITFGLLESEIEENLLVENSLNPAAIQVDPSVIQGLAMGAGFLPRKNISSVGKKSQAMSYSEMLTSWSHEPQYVIEGLLPENSVSLFAGDSGIGKSPFLVQMGLSVATGIPFLGTPVTKGVCLLVDYENGQDTLLRFTKTISQYLGLLPGQFENFQILHGMDSPEAVRREILHIQPKLVLIDAIRGYDSALEDKNTEAGKRLTELLQFAETEQTSILLLHHLRKTSTNPDAPAQPLESTPVMEWMQQVSGPRALVNQTATRIASEKYFQKGSELILKWHFKGRGEAGPWYVSREYDESGEPIAYKRVTGTSLLTPDHIQLLNLLPDTFSFKTIEEVQKKTPKAASAFARRVQEAGLAIKSGSGKTTRYSKNQPPKPK